MLAEVDEMTMLQLLAHDSDAIAIRGKRDFRNSLVADLLACAPREIIAE